jgi:hypothetical protein
VDRRAAAAGASKVGGRILQELKQMTHGLEQVAAGAEVTAADAILNS